MNSIDVHADDYALTVQSDEDILELCRAGKLNSISIIPNLSVFDSAVKKFFLLENHDQINVSVHLNFMEGKSICDKSLVPDLVDDDGYFSVSWSKLLIWNFSLFKYHRIKEQLKTEIKNQILRCAENNLVDLTALRIDSHQHPHMIPVVYDAVFEVVKENGWKIEFIRNSCDPVLVYAKHISLIKTANISNVIKCFILDFFSVRYGMLLKKMKIPSSILCGVFLSGKMDGRVQTVIEDFKKLGLKKKVHVEFLFHPGKSKVEELTSEFKKAGFNEFHISENRKIEADTVRNFLAPLP